MRLQKVFICCTYLCWSIYTAFTLQIIHQNNDFNVSRDVAIQSDENMSEEVRLLHQLMKGYDRDVRPMKNASQSVVIRLGITLTQIFDLDEKNQVLVTSVWLDLEWLDDYLSWNPNNYSGLKNLRVPCERLWLPDIVLYNNADDYTQKYMSSRAMVSSDGNVFWPPPTKMRSKCPVDVTYFPFDEQSCELKLGSWIYDGFQVDVTNRTDRVDVSNYVPNGEWELVETRVKRNVVYYPCCPEPFPDVTITLVIRRKTLFYISNIILPCVMMSGLTLLVFRLPPDAGEKITLGFTVLLAFSVFILNIGEKMPETSNSVPLIGMYLTAVMAITSLSITMTVVVLSYHYRGHLKSPPPPQWLKWIVINRLSGLFCSDVVRRARVQQMNDNANARTLQSEHLQYHNANCEARQSSFFQLQPMSHNDGENLEPNDGHSSLNCQLDLEFLKVLVLMTNKHKFQQEISENVNEWRTIALVLDRFLFWVFLIVIIGLSTVFLLAVPYSRIGE